MTPAVYYFCLHNSWALWSTPSCSSALPHTQVPNTPPSWHRQTGKGTRAAVPTSRELSHNLHTGMLSVFTSWAAFCELHCHHVSTPPLGASVLKPDEHTLPCVSHPSACPAVEIAQFLLLCISRLSMPSEMLHYSRMFSQSHHTIARKSLPTLFTGTIFFGAEDSFLPFLCPVLEAAFLWISRDCPLARGHWHSTAFIHTAELGWSMGLDLACSCTGPQPVLALRPCLTSGDANRHRPKPRQGPFWAASSMDDPGQNADLCSGFLH